MKNINEFITEKLAKVNASSLKNFDWRCKHISKEDFFKFALAACKEAKVYPSDVIEEISQFEDPDELERQWEAGHLNYYIKWEDALIEKIANDDKYSGKEGDIADYAFGDAYEIFNKLLQFMN